MSEVIECFGFQFLPNDSLPSSLRGQSEFRPFDEHDILVRCEIRKEGHRVQPTYENPWPSTAFPGAHYPVDSYSFLKWPTYIKITCHLTVGETVSISDELAKEIIQGIRVHMWASFETMPSLSLYKDQILTERFYRRAYFAEESIHCDIVGNPRPCSLEKYRETKIGEAKGPGFIVFPNRFVLVWSQVIPVRRQLGLPEDLPQIKKRVDRLRLHYNSYHELEEARKHIGNFKLKAAIRFAAPSVEASLKYYCQEWCVPFPTERNLNFKEKIKKILSDANKPSYDESELDNLLILYRARNSMHEADLFFKGTNGEKKRITIAKAKDLVESAIQFTLWLDSHE